MKTLSYSSLQEAYAKALELNLDDNFIVMIEDELFNRTSRSNKDIILHDVQ